MALKLTASIWQEGEQFVSLCPELGVSSCGDNPTHALAMLQEAVELYLDNAKELNIIDDLELTLSSKPKFQTTFEVESI